MKIWLESLGCSRNQVDSEIMLGRLVEAGHIIDDDPSTADLIIVNTCGFISDAADEAVDTILEMAEYKTHGSCRHLVVTGCLPERFKNDDLASSLPEVDLFLGTGAVDFIVKAVEDRIKDTGLRHKTVDGTTGSIDGTDVTCCGTNSTGKLGGTGITCSTGDIAAFFPDPGKRKFQAAPFKRKLTLDYSAYVKISEGCNRKCTYCIIPVLRGKQRSRPIDDIIAETKNLVLQGVKEIIFTGENTTDYGHETELNSAALPLNEHKKSICDFDKNKLFPINKIKPNESELNESELNRSKHDKIDLACLLNMLSIELDKIVVATPLSGHDPNNGHGADHNLGKDLRKESKVLTNHEKSSLIHKVSDIEQFNGIWLRLLYTHPSSLSHEIIRSISKLKKVCSYYDVPVQHASSKILKKMGRPYTKQDLYSLFKFIRKNDPDAVLRTTIITGFPGETDGDFQILLDFIKEIKFDNLGVFTYSDSKDLKSHNFANHVPEDLARQRQDIIMAEQAKISEKINEKHLGKVYKVLVEENPDDGIFLGRTSFQAPEVDGITFIYGSGLEIGSFVDVRITETFEYDLAGEIEIP